jgi:RNA polymerase sigma factor (sigma-70 family)
VAAARDQEYVGRHDDEKLRRFRVARRAGDEAEARRWWDDLLTDNYDRVRNMVVLESRGHLSHDEQEEAVQLALIKIANNMIHTFRGTSMGEWVESTRKLVKYACMDTQRRAMVISKRERSLDRTDGDDKDAGRWDADVYAAIEAKRREQESDEEEAEALREGKSFLDWAVPQLSPKRRAVIELDRAEVPVEEIQERLGVTRDVVYASRSRALKDLAKLRDQHKP